MWKLKLSPLSPSKGMAKFKTAAGVLFWEFINGISVKEELPIGS
jgi:hypothetical protein